MEIKQRLLPKGSSNKPDKPQCPAWITMHNTDNIERGANAAAHARYLLKGSGGRQASWHYSVDDKEIYQHLQDTEQGWHAGDGRGPGNTSSIGIEVCMHLGIHTEQSWRHAAELVAHLLNKHKLPIERVVPHKKWSGKYCLRQILPYWDKFIGMVKGELRKLQQPKITGKGEPCKPLQSKVRIIVKGKNVCSGTLAKGRVTAPVRLIAYALGAKVGWDGKYALVNGVKITRSHLINGTAHALVREVAEVCKAKLHFDNKKQELYITK